MKQLCYTVEMVFNAADSFCEDFSWGICGDILEADSMPEWSKLRVEDAGNNRF